MRQRFFLRSFFSCIIFFNFSFLYLSHSSFLLRSVFLASVTAEARVHPPASRAVVNGVHISLRTNENTTAIAKKKNCVRLNDDDEVLKRVNDVMFEQLSVGFP